MKNPSKLGADIESAVINDGRFVRHRKSIKYLSYFRTLRGTVFAFERVTTRHINLWVPEQQGAMRMANRAGLITVRTVPWPDRSDANRYGRLSSLKSVPELCNESLLKIQAKTVGEAVGVFGVLL